MHPKQCDGLVIFAVCQRLRRIGAAYRASWWHPAAPMRIRRDRPTLRASVKHDGNSRWRSRLARVRASIRHQSWTPPLRQRFVDGRFPMNPLFLRPMCVQFGDLLISRRRQCRTPIRYCCFAVLFAVGNNTDLNLVSRERRGHNYVLHPAVPDVVCGEQPKSIPAVAGACSEYDALALYALYRVNETRRPIWRPFCLAYGSKKRRYIRDRAV